MKGPAVLCCRAFGKAVMMERNTYDDYYGDDGIPGKEPERNSPFYAPPAKKRRGGGVLLKLWRLLYPVLIHNFGIEAISNVFITIFLAASVFFGMFFNESSAYDFLYNNQIAISGAAEVIVFVPLLVFFIRDEQKRRALSPQDCLRKKKMGFIDWLVIASFVMSLVLLSNLLIALLNLPETEVEQEFEEIYNNTKLWVQIIVVGIVAPFCEEMVFRGLVFRRLRDDLDPLYAALISGIAFGVYHGNLSQGIFASILGFAFAMIYEHYGTIAAPIFCHMFNNFYATLTNELYYKADLTIPDPLYYLILAAALVASVALPVFIFHDDEKCNEY